MSTKPSNSAESRHSRREYLRRIGATAGAVAVIGAGGSQVAPQYSPIGRAEAIAPAAVAFYLASGAAAGVTTASVADLWSRPSTDIDPDDVLSEQIYQSAQSVAAGRESFVDEMEHDFLGVEDPQNTPYGRVAWQSIRSSSVREAVNGGTESDVAQAAQQAHREQTTKSIVNMVERWNTAINALAEEIVLTVEEGLQDTLNLEYGDFAVADLSYAEPLEVGQSDAFDGDGSVLWEIDVDLPMDETDLDQRDEPLKLVFPSIDRNGDVQGAAPWLGQWMPAENEDWRSTPVVQAEHASLDTVTVIDGDMMASVVSEIDDAYAGIQNDLNTYVENLYQGVHEGAIDPSDVLSSQDIVDEFADSDEQTRVAAELLAAGANVPDSAGYRAQISHPDLQSDELWGMLYPQFDGNPMTIAPGMTLDPEDYNMAYFGYGSEIDDDWQTVTLSGEEPLEILRTDGVEGQESIESVSAEAGEYGRVVLWTGEDPPDPIAEPTDHDGWMVVVEGDTERHVADVADVVEDGDDWVLETTDLSSGETIATVEVVPSVEHSRSIDYVADPTEVDSDETLERMEALRQQVDDLEDALEDDGFWGGGGFGDFGGIPGWGIAAGVVVIAIGLIANSPFGRAVREARRR